MLADAVCSTVNHCGSQAAVLRCSNTTSLYSALTQNDQCFLNLHLTRPGITENNVYLKQRWEGGNQLQTQITESGSYGSVFT